MRLGGIGRVRAGLVSLCIAGALIGVGAVGNGGAATPAAKSKSTITIKDFKFKPTPFKVKAGAKVTVKNADDTTHTLTADKGAFDAGEIESGDSGSVVVKKPGTYKYHCEIHNFMKGSITAT
jgi:plastocyanin